MHVNASLNALATVLLLVGFVLIKTRPRRSAQAHDAHGVRRLGRVPGVLPLVSLAGRQRASSRIPAPFATSIYAILASHVLLAITVPFLAIRQIYLGFRALGCCAANCRRPKNWPPLTCTAKSTSAWPAGHFPSGSTSRSRA